MAYWSTNREWPSSIRMGALFPIPEVQFIPIRILITIPRTLAEMMSVLGDPVLACPSHPLQPNSKAGSSARLGVDIDLAVHAIDKTLRNG